MCRARGLPRHQEHRRPRHERWRRHPRRYTPRRCRGWWAAVRRAASASAALTVASNRDTTVGERSGARSPSPPLPPSSSPPPCAQPPAPDPATPPRRPPSSPPIPPAVTASSAKSASTAAHATRLSNEKKSLNAGKHTSGGHDRREGGGIARRTKSRISSSAPARAGAPPLSLSPPVPSGLGAGGRPAGPEIAHAAPAAAGPRVAAEKKTPGQVAVESVLGSLAAARPPSAAAAASTASAEALPVASAAACATRKRRSGRRAVGCVMVYSVKSRRTRRVAQAAGVSARGGRTAAGSSGLLSIGGVSVDGVSVDGVSVGGVSVDGIWVGEICSSVARSRRYAESRPTVRPRAKSNSKLRRTNSKTPGPEVARQAVNSPGGGEGDREAGGGRGVDDDDLLCRHSPSAGADARSLAPPFAREVAISRPTTPEIATSALTNPEVSISALTNPEVLISAAMDPMISSAETRRRSRAASTSPWGGIHSRCADRPWCGTRPPPVSSSRCAQPKAEACRRAMRRSAAFKSNAGGGLA
eukprot:scaffold4386_cov105-Isochrysis_galbana.AAC.5